MLPPTDNSQPCEKFEANVFASSRCQNCLRSLRFHQPDDVVEHPEDHAILEASYYDVASESEAQDPLCILAPQCDLYICQSSEERSDSCQETLTCTLVRGKAESLQASTNVDVLSAWEMTRLMVPTVSTYEKQDRMFPVGRQESLQLRDSNMNSRNQSEGWKKGRMESGYFSLERRKSESNRVPSPVHPASESRSRRPSCKDPVASSISLGTGRKLTSSVRSLDSELNWGTVTSSSGHGLVRHNYTALADIPKLRRLSSQEGFDRKHKQAGLGLRTQSPGRAEVERMFGQERKKADVLEAFQALEAGLIHRLEGKSFVGLQRRRQSSPILYREEATLARKEMMSRRMSLRPLSHPDKGSEKASRPKEPDWKNRDGLLHPTCKQNKTNQKLAKSPMAEKRHWENVLKPVGKSNQVERYNTKQMESNQMKWKDRNPSQRTEKSSKTVVLSAQDMKQRQLGHSDWIQSTDKYIKSQHDSVPSQTSTRFSSQSFERFLYWTSNRTPSQSSNKPPSRPSDRSSSQVSHRCLSRNSDSSPSRNSDRSSFRSDRSPSRQSDCSFFQYSDRSPSQCSESSQASIRSPFQPSDKCPSWSFQQSLSCTPDRPPSWTYDRSFSPASYKSHSQSSEMPPSLYSEQPLTRQTNTSDRDFYLTTSKTYEKETNKEEEEKTSRNHEKQKQTSEVGPKRKLY
ncbi:uncharacterized protein LOC115477295 [Microcaecilia unicolor]|uniref:Uncharacterized protein LOC115477295 n=1 Tax=Microcaecilia unicolor TaxID=1415580 RepID=A0A6P7YRZ3_9AMPH|nr:uncharacterized protein LOC115477295 [Microcaecilia unicolor]